MQQPSIDQLRRALQIAEQIQKLEAQLAAILGASPTPSVENEDAAPKRRKRRKMSAAGRAAIAAAQKARWAKIKAK